MLKQSVMRPVIYTGLSVLMLAATGAVAQSFGPVQTAPMMTMQGTGQVFQGQRWHGFSNHRGAVAIIDQNGDGLVQPDEAAARFERRFRRYDGDGDGMVVKDEYMAVRMRAGRHGQAPKYSQLEAQFASMDANKDGKVTKGEFLAMGESQYKSSDGNGDGKISVWEYRAARGVK
jgi:hypothetical protein